MIPLLAPPDSFHVEAAQGWLELGNPAEAGRELDQVAEAARTHPAVLAMRWQVLAATKQWEAALDTAAALVQAAPEEPLGWIHRSFALHELRRTAEARDHLLRVVDRFPTQALMRYNLACYECQLGRLDQARAWLQKSFLLGDPRNLRQLAREDPDLAPLRGEIP